MRRSILSFLGCTAFALAGCSDQGPTDLSKPDEPQLQEAEVMALTSSNPTILDLRMQSDELLREPARTLARFALAKVQLDINQNKPTLYVSSLVFAAIPLVERRMHRIPEAKIGRLIDLLCTLQKLIGPKLPPKSRLNMIPWCQLSPEELGNEAEFQLVTNATGATVTTNTDQLSLKIAANTLADAAGNPVASAFFTILPIQRRDPTVEASHPCPQPFDPRYSDADCYPEFYEVRSQPLVQFVNTPALLQVCQLDPHLASPDAPTHEVLDRLRLFARSAAGAIALLPKFIEGEEIPPTVNQLACAGDGDLHPEEEDPGPIGMSREGIQNAWSAVTRLASRAVKSLGPRTLYASNVPTHGRIERELIDFAGTIVGAIDLGDPGCESDCPSPILALRSVEPGDGSTTYNLTVTNRAVYSDALFAASPNLDPCGLNNNASRTWVDIFNAQTGAYIYGFCALGRAEDLNLIWFTRDNESLPNSVYITMEDRLTDTIYRSNNLILNETPVP